MTDLEPKPTRRFGRLGTKYAYRKNGELQNDISRTDMLKVLTDALNSNSGPIEIKFSNVTIELEKIA